MNSKTLTILLVVAAATVAAAAVALRSGASGTEAASGQQKLFPKLEGSVNDVASIRVQRAAESYTVHRVGDAWTLQDKGDFPVQMDQVRKVANVLREATTIEAKTSDPAKYAKLGVQDVDAPDAKSVLVTLADKDGKALASLVVGKEVDSDGPQGSGRFYVRRAGEAQSWVANLKLDLHEKATDWLAKEIVKVPQGTVRSIEIRQPDGDTLLVDRASADTKDFTLHGIPAGKEPTYPSVANSLATGLEFVNLEDVAPASDVDFSTGTGPIARYTTFDGLVVTVTTKDQDGKNYASFSASYEPPPDAAPPAMVAPDAEKTPETPPKPAAKSPEEVKQEVEALNARLSKWAYVISSYSRAQFGKKLSEMVKDPAPPASIAAPDGAAIPEDDGMGDADSPVVIPSDLPPEIRDQIKAHQESIGNKTVDGPPRNKTAEPNAEEPPVDPAPDAKPDSTPPHR
jgi:hypothetical protein